MSCRMSLGSDKTQKSILIAVFITAGLLISIGWFIVAMVDQNNDWPNALTLVVEVAIGALIATIVYIHSKAQHNTSQKLNSKMSRILAELKRSHMEERELVTDALVLRLGDVIRNLDYVLKSDERYDAVHPEEEKEFLTRQQQKMNNLVSQSDLGIHYYELARIFDRKTVTMYQNLQIQLQEIRSFSSIEHYDVYRADNVECCKRCVDQCRMLSGYVEKHMKDHDTASNAD